MPVTIRPCEGENLATSPEVEWGVAPGLRLERRSCSLTVSCTAIVLARSASRETAARLHAPSCRFELSKSDAHTCASQLREMESNQRLRIQRPPSYRLDEPGVRPQGIEPCPTG